jgi:hypothetical protein
MVKKRCRLVRGDRRKSVMDPTMGGMVTNRCRLVRGDRKKSVTDPTTGAMVKG